MNGPPKANRSALPVDKLRRREFEIIAVVGDIGVAEAPAERAEVERRDIARSARGALDDMDVDDAQGVELIDDIVELRLGVAARDAVGGRDRRNPDAGALGADLLDHRSRNLQHQPGAVLDRSAIRVGADVGAVLGELVQQIAVGAVDFDAIEARRDGVCGRLPEIVHDARQFVEFERARLRNVNEAVVDEGLGLSPDRRRRNRRSAVLLQIDVARHGRHARAAGKSARPWRARRS